MGTLPKIARAALHRWEEPCISGTHGSGAVFFSGCGLRCVFCQNESISQRGEGKIVTPKRLSEIFRELEAQGAHNINLVTAAHFVPAVLDALALYRPSIPIVYNSSGYESVETLRMLEGAVDIYLPDYKYIDPNMAAMLSGARDYPDTAHAAIDEMVRQTGAPVYDQDGMMTRGTLIRHLVLPGLTGDSIRILEQICDDFPGIPVSLAVYALRPGALHPRHGQKDQKEGICPRAGLYGGRRAERLSAGTRLGGRRVHSGVRRHGGLTQRQTRRARRRADAKGMSEMQACFLPADILLPDAAADFEKWAVVACDQFTSQPEYWRKAAEIVGDAR